MGSHAQARTAHWQSRFKLKYYQQLSHLCILQGGSAKHALDEHRQAQGMQGVLAAVVRAAARFLVHAQSLLTALDSGSQAHHQPVQNNNTFSKQQMSTSSAIRAEQGISLQHPVSMGIYCCMLQCKADSVKRVCSQHGTVALKHSSNLCKSQSPCSTLSASVQV